MRTVKLLDCTLRDGGFVNDWKFGHDDIVNIFERSVSAGCDIIEVGFLDERREFDRDRTIMPDTAAVNEIFRGLDCGNSMIVGMIDYGTCGIEKVCDKKDSILDGIRVIFKKKDRFQALELIRAIQKKGYKVFVQPVSVTGYSDEELTDLIGRVNEIKPHAMSVVDTYGLLHQGNLMHYFELMDNHLDSSVAIGYHAHNNFQLGYSNSIALIEKDTDRDLVVDGSGYGMGKGAGNAPLELLAMYANEHLGGQYEINQILEMIDVNLIKIYLKAPWGYSVKYYLAASNDCHPTYVQHLMQKRTLSIKSVNEILAMIAPEEKLAYNKEHIEDLYQKYQQQSINDADTLQTLERELKGKKIVVLGPGKSIRRQKAEIQAYLAKYKPTVITINYDPEDFYTDYIFLSNSKRYVGLANRLLKEENKGKIIATSNVTKTAGEFDYTVDYSGLIDLDAEIVDNSLLMLLKLLIRLGIREAELAGFDGYSSEKGENYFNVAMEYAFVKDNAERLNEFTRRRLQEISGDIKIHFVTASRYESGKGETDGKTRESV